ncbi:MAG: GNAT family N-acetyltransferase [Burkholderiales bacterium]
MTLLKSSEDRNSLREANDPDSSTETLIRLSKSDDELIRAAVAYNRSTPDFVINTLTTDRSEEVQSCLRKRGMLKKPIFVKPQKIVGNNVVFRNANKDDAAFILQLRTDPVKGKYLSKVENEINIQVAWLEKYEKDDTQIYFIIENKSSEKFGTIRLYDKIDDSFCWGSWILKEGRPSGFAMESALMVYHYAIALGFEKSHFDVRKGNESVWKFHERFGALRAEESNENYFYNISSDAIQKSLEKYGKYLPNGIRIIN